MASLFDTRRYLTDFDSVRTANVLTDTLVVGTGVAGARAAIEAARYGLVILLTKSGFDDSCTHYAQGGIAAAMAPGDSPQAHLNDTLRVGCGLSRKDAVRILVNEARDRLEELISWGFEADLVDDRPALGREGGHSANRIIHAHGDQTGQELSRTLQERVSATAEIRVFDHCFLIDLITVDGVCVGAVTFHEKYGHQIIWAKQTVLASGGCGRIWRETTNPAVATGDGIAAAYRAGAKLRSMEMVQFHPTTLYVAGAARALISEAVRGEGATLIDRSGNRFMDRYHPDKELAPRDVVSRAIHDHLAKTGANCVYVDVRHIKGFKDRFPQVARLCADFEIDVSRDGIPVRPSAHYMIGGVDVQLDGSTTVDGLLCCGEAACTGVHGANRIASNSLLEGLVFGRLAGETAGRRAAGTHDAAPLHRLTSANPRSTRTALDVSDISNSLRSVMWRNVGIVRDSDHLRETCEILDFWAHYTLDKTFDDVHGWETQNQLTVARLVAASALERSDSIGVHFRADGKPDPGAASLYHLTITRNGQGTSVARDEVTK
ncbi:MAG: L-aspartate oxidase [Phycisphaerae bacterium]|jgi:L-aspartate oxidase